MDLNEITMRIISQIKKFELDKEFDCISPLSVSAIDYKHALERDLSLANTLQHIANEVIYPQVLKRIIRSIGVLSLSELTNDFMEGLTLLLEEYRCKKIFYVLNSCYTYPFSVEILNNLSGLVKGDTLLKFIGTAAVKSLSLFFKSGKWNLGQIVSQNGTKNFLYFGNPNDEPIDVWSLPFRGTQYYCGYESIWFAGILGVDWNAILHGNTEEVNSLNVPKEDINNLIELKNKIIEDCPIKLEENDDDKVIQLKINRYALGLPKISTIELKKASFKESLMAAGYTRASWVYDSYCEQKGEDESYTTEQDYLADGRPDPESMMNNAWPDNLNQILCDNYSEVENEIFPNIESEIDGILTYKEIWEAIENGAKQFIRENYGESFL